jgi:undecaprenyl diphosphate synthase
MDGNGRWASARGKPRTYGHLKGTRVAKKIITSCSRRGIKHLTLYAFSSENWLRPHSEVSFLMLLLRRYLKRETANLVKENIHFDVIGDIYKLPSDIIRAIEYAKLETRRNTGLQLTFAISYGSRQEITHAVQEIAQKVSEGLLKPDEITEDTISQHLQTSLTPDPDFIIRTSGEKRLSNFLLWQAAYSEFYFSDTLWPDFTEADLDQAITQYLGRERRFGAISFTENASH